MTGPAAPLTMAHPPADPQGTRRATAFVLVTVVLNTMGLGLIVPVLPKLILSLNGGDVGGAGLVIASFSIIYAGLQFVVSPLQGVLSDRFGRRPVLLASAFGAAIDYAIMTVAPSLVWLFVGRGLSAVAAGNTSVVYSYLADLTDEQGRARAYGLVGAAAGVGIVAGPLIGGYFGELHLRLPFALAAALNLINAAYGAFVLRESLAAAARTRKVRWEHANPLTAIFAF